MIMGAYQGQLCLLDFRSEKMRSRVDQRLQKGLMAEYIEKDDPVLIETENSSMNT